MQATDSTSLDDILQRLYDRQAIAERIAQLGRMLDEKRFDDARSILADDVVVQTPGGEARGFEAVVAQAQRTHTVRNQHAISDVLIDLDGDRAQARANLIVTFAADPGARLVVGDAEHPDSFLTLGEVLSLRGGPHRRRLAALPDRVPAPVEQPAAPRTPGGRPDHRLIGGPPADALRTAATSNVSHLSSPRC